MDYLAQIMASHIQGILETFVIVTYALKSPIKPLFIENGSSTYGYKFISNYYAKWRTKYGIILIPYFSISLNINPIDKCWRCMKQALHRRCKQPTTKTEIEAAIIKK